MESCPRECGPHEPQDSFHRGDILTPHNPVDTGYNRWVAVDFQGRTSVGIQLNLKWLTQILYESIFRTYLLQKSRTAFLSVSISNHSLWALQFIYLIFLTEVHFLWLFWQNCQSWEFILFVNIEYERHVSNI